MKKSNALPAVFILFGTAPAIWALTFPARVGGCSQRLQEKLHLDRKLTQPSDFCIRGLRKRYGHRLYGQAASQEKNGPARSKQLTNHLFGLGRAGRLKREPY